MVLFDRRGEGSSARQQRISIGSFTGLFSFWHVALLNIVFFFFGQSLQKNYSYIQWVCDTWHDNSRTRVGYAATWCAIVYAFSRATWRPLGRKGLGLSHLAVDTCKVSSIWSGRVGLGTLQLLGDRAAHFPLRCKTSGLPDLIHSS